MRDIQEVTLQLKSTIHHPDSRKAEETTVTVSGLVTVKNNTTYLRYEEELEEIGTVHHTIKIKPEEVTVLRQGPLSMRMPLSLNRETEGSYQTPFGRMEMLTKAKKLDYKWNEAKETGVIHLVYELTMQGDYIGLCDIRYQITGGQ